MNQQDYRARASAALDGSLTAFALASEVQDRVAQLKHSDPEYDVAGRIAGLYRAIGEELADLHETFVRYADSYDQPAVAS